MDHAGHARAPHRERAHPTHERGRRPVGRAGHVPLGRAGEQLGEEDPGLHPRERGAEAEVLAEPEREVRRVDRTGHVERGRRSGRTSVSSRLAEAYSMITNASAGSGTPADLRRARSRSGRTPGSASPTAGTPPPRRGRASGRPRARPAAPGAPTARAARRTGGGAWSRCPATSNERQKMRASAWVSGRPPNSACISIDVRSSRGCATRSRRCSSRNCQSSPARASTSGSLRVGRLDHGVGPAPEVVAVGVADTEELGDHLDRERRGERADGVELLARPARRRAPRPRARAPAARSARRRAA